MATSKIHHLELRWRRSSGGPWSYATLKPDQTSFELPRVVRGWSYDIQVRSVTINGTCSDWGQATHTVASGGILVVAPSAITATVVADGVTVTWTITGRTPSDMRYQVERAPDVSGAPGAWTVLGNIDGLTWHDGVTDGGTYWYRVKAISYTQDSSAYVTIAAGVQVKQGANVGLSNITATLGGGNQLKNTSFENLLNALDQWTSSGAGTYTTAAADTTKKADQGNQSAKFVQTAGGLDTYYYQRFTRPKANTKYTFSAWVFVQSIAAGAVANRAILLTDGTASAEDDTLTTGHVVGSWLRHRLTFTTSANPGYVECRFYNPNGTVYWDACQLEEGDVATAYSPNPADILPGTVVDTVTTRGASVDNIWPNPGSETMPPDLADLTTAEWAGRVNYGVGSAYSGAWVRRLTPTARNRQLLGDQRGAPASASIGGGYHQSQLGLTLPCSPGESFYLEAYLNFFTTPPGAVSSVTLTPSGTGGTLAAGTYYVRVSAFNASAEGGAPTEYSAVTTGTTGSIAVSWPAVTGATGYYVYVGTTAGQENVYFAPGNVTSFTIANLSGTTGSPITGNTGAGVFVYYLDSTGAAIGGVAVSTISYLTSVTGWNKATAYATAPAGTVSARLFAWQDGFYQTSFDSFYARRMAGNEIFDRSGFGALRSPNYAESGGNPTAGVKIDLLGTSPTIKMVSGQMQIDSYIFDAGGNSQFFGRLKNALTNIGSEFWYVGSSSGAPANAYSLYHRGIFGGTNYGVMHIGFSAPYGLANNFDGMRYITLWFYSPAGAALDGPWSFALPDQRHSNVPGANNDVRTTLPATVVNATYNLIGSWYTFNGYLRAQLFNSTGSTVAGDWDCRSTSINAVFSYLGVNQIPGAPAPPGGDSGGTGACPAPQTKVQLASGLWIDAADVHEGMKLKGFDEHDPSKPRIGTVRNPTVKWERRVDLALASGKVSSFSLDHRLVTDAGWKKIQDLRPGDTLPTVSGKTEVVKAIKRIGKAPIVAFSVEGCQTYYTDGLASHNVKP